MMEDINGSRVCPELNFGIVILKLLLTLPVAMPYLFGIYMQTLNEQKLFLWGENNAKQQQTMLDIFNQQHDGVVLLKQPNSDPGNTD